MIDRRPTRGATLSNQCCRPDRAYTQNNEEDWALPLREREISQVLDLKKTGQKYRPVTNGIVVNGGTHCPATPQAMLGELIPLDEPDCPHEDEHQQLKKKKGEPCPEADCDTHLTKSESKERRKTRAERNQETVEARWTRSA